MPTVPSVHQGDHYFSGNVKLNDVTLPAGCVEADDVEANAGIEATKLQHQHRPEFNQPNTTATAETRVVYRCYGATGTIVGFHAGSIVACAGAATITVDLRKNGVSVLTGVITLDSTNTARVAEAGTLSVTTLVQGDVLEVVTTATAGGGTIGTGLFAFAEVREDAQ